jgi:peptide/nickel transport system permease protein
MLRHVLPNCMPQYIFSQKYWISFYPGLVLLVMIVAMNLLGDRLRDVTNPRLER